MSVIDILDLLAWVVVSFLAGVVFRLESKTVLQSPGEFRMAVARIVVGEIVMMALFGIPTAGDWMLIGGCSVWGFVIAPVMKTIALKDGINQKLCLLIFEGGDGEETAPCFDSYMIGAVIVVAIGSLAIFYVRHNPFEIQGSLTLIGLLLIGVKIVAGIVVAAVAAIGSFVFANVVGEWAEALKAAQRQERCASSGWFYHKPQMRQRSDL